jgi:hypothetical protein
MAYTSCLENMSLDVFPDLERHTIFRSNNFRSIGKQQIIN